MFTPATVAGRENTPRFPTSTATSRPELVHFFLDPLLRSPMPMPSSDSHVERSLPYRTNLDLLVNAISENDEDKGQSNAEHNPPMHPASNNPVENESPETTHAAPDDTRMRSLLAASLAVSSPAYSATSGPRSNSSNQAPTYTDDKVVVLPSLRSMFSDQELIVGSPPHYQHGKRKREEDRRADDIAEPDSNRRRVTDLPRALPGDVPLSSMTTVSCLHASVAQKSYGHEKRFLCPPPLVRIETPIKSMRDQRLTMSVVTEDGARLAEQSNTMDDMTQFKYLHVGGASTKSKSFHLSLEIATPESAAGPSSSLTTTTPHTNRTWASFESAPVTIISKPSKKTAKTRNVSTCIMDGGSVSLFNRINSQTVRTKYMTVDRAELAASNASWSAFRVQILDDDDRISPSGIQPSNVAGSSREAGSVGQSYTSLASPRPIHYGSRVVLTDETTGISSEPLIVRKVDKGKLSKTDGGLVSQMQKIALQRASANSDVPSSTGLYLSAGRLPLPVHSADRSVLASTHTQAMSDGKTVATAHPLTYQAPRVTANATGVDEVDDYLCWTIVGISEYRFTFFDASTTHPPANVPSKPITPFPVTLNPPVYHPSTNRLEIDVYDFFFNDPRTNDGTPTPMEIWLGTIGPLVAHNTSQSASKLFGRPEPPVPQPRAAPIEPDKPSSHFVSGHVHSGHDTGQEGGFRSVVEQYVTISIEMPTLQTVMNALRRERGSPLEGQASSSSSSRSKSRELDPGGGGSTSAQALPLIFVRPSDRIGYLSGHSIACESMFQARDPSLPQGWTYRVL